MQLAYIFSASCAGGRNPWAFQFKRFSQAGRTPVETIISEGLDYLANGHLFLLQLCPIVAGMLQLMHIHM
jgi:hypothetical protein